MAKKIDPGVPPDEGSRSLRWTDGDGDKITIGPVGQYTFIMVSLRTVVLEKRQIRGIIAKLEELLEQ